MKKSQASKRNGTENQSAFDEAAFMKLFEDGLKDIYWVEKALIKAIPKMIKKSMSEELIDALEEHLEITEEQVNKVEEVFSMIGKKAVAKKCIAMAGTLEEGEEVMMKNDGMVRDAAIIAAAQKVEHYEIAAYGTLCAFANTLALEDAAELLNEILDEEKEADVLLSEISESAVNAEASQE